MKYAAMVIDLKSSKKMTHNERIKCQNKLIKIINIGNEMFQMNLKIKLAFSAGDSIQGLFSNLKSAIYCYIMIKILLYPYEIRCGIGYGDIIKEFIVKDSNMADGEAYHFAASAIELAKKEDCSILIKSNGDLDIVINEIFNTINGLENDQTSKQRDINNLINILQPIYYDANFYFNKIEFFIFDNIKNYKVSRVSEDSIVKTNENDIYHSSKIKKKLIDTSITLIIGNMLGINRESIRQMIQAGKMNQIRRLYLLIIYICEKGI